MADLGCYEKVVSAVFLRRPNRFIAICELDGREETVHVKNTGRCRELLITGAKVYLAESDNPARKTKYDLIAVEKVREGKPSLLINVDSQLPNELAEEWLPRSGIFSEKANIRREVRYGNSRFDFYIEDGARKCFLEVKGVTLEKNGAVLFPDAPTDRGIKHVKELVSCLAEGYEGYLLFVVQMEECSVFRPNMETHPAFGRALREAEVAGVKLLAMRCRTTPDRLSIESPLPIELPE